MNLVGQMTDRYTEQYWVHLHEHIIAHLYFLVSYFLARTLILHLIIFVSPPGTLVYFPNRQITWTLVWLNLQIKFDLSLSINYNTLIIYSNSFYDFYKRCQKYCKCTKALLWRKMYRKYFFDNFYFKDVVKELFLSNFL